MSKDREIQYLHMRCNNLNDKLSLALNVLNEMINDQAQRINPNTPEGQLYQSISYSCLSVIDKINAEWKQVESEYSDVINSNERC